jgi:uncharacterized protein
LKARKNDFRRREPGLGWVEAFDLGKYNPGLLTELEILDKGCWAACARNNRRYDNYRKESERDVSFEDNPGGATLILYLDTSSLVKLYLTEAHSGNVRGWSEEAEIVATCRIAYPEMVSALTRRYRCGDLSKPDYELLLKTFNAEWSHFAVVDFDEIAAGRLAEKHGLRGFDAVHLASAKELKYSQPRISLAFSSFYGDLNKAAAAENMKVLEPK